MMEKEGLLERYEALGEEADFLAAKPLYEQALAESADARLLNEYGYLLECHGRRELRSAVEPYEQAIALDPGYDKPHYQLISARDTLVVPAEVLTWVRDVSRRQPSRASPPTGRTRPAGQAP